MNRLAVMLILLGVIGIIIAGSDPNQDRFSDLSRCGSRCGSDFAGRARNCIEPTDPIETVQPGYVSEIFHDMFTEPTVWISQITEYDLPRYINARRFYDGS